MNISAGVRKIHARERCSTSRRRIASGGVRMRDGEPDRGERQDRGDDRLGRRCRLGDDGAGVVDAAERRRHPRRRSANRRRRR